jgi:uncharacterized membrane protein YdjX (TVP38/TMEM64 family)
VSTPADDRRTPARAPGHEDSRGAVRARPAFRRLAPLIVIGGLVALAYGFGLHRDVSFETLVRNRTAIDHFIAQHGIAAVAGYVALYVAVVGLSLPGGLIMTVAGGFLFGPVIGTIAAIVGALAGATLIFLIARSACGEWLVRRAGPFAEKLAAGFRADAFSYLLFLRLVPFPFWLINLAPALFGVRLSTFVVATAIGILPATLTLAVFGAGVGSIITAQESQYNACLAAGRADCKVDFDLSQVLTPTLLLALGALALLALVPAFARRIFRRKIDVNASPKRL